MPSHPDLRSRLLSGAVFPADVDVLETQRAATPGLILGVFFIGIFLPRIIIEFVKNNQEAFEDTMLLNMGQLLSVPFVLAGIYLVYRAMTRPKEHLTFPDRYADEPSSGKH